MRAGFLAAAVALFIAAGLVHGYTVAFTWGLGALILAAVVAFLFVTKQDGPAEGLAGDGDAVTSLERAEVLAGTV